MKNQHHGSYCSAARSIEVVGEKWSLLVVRDLLYGPRRFSDLLATVGGVTPKLLTQRLRELEASGVVARDEEPGRRDVWYSLTEAGLALRPVVRELVLWGIYHGPPPEPDETSRSRRAAATVVAVFNREALFPANPCLGDQSRGRRSQPVPIRRADLGSRRGGSGRLRSTRDLLDPARMGRSPSGRHARTRGTREIDPGRGPRRNKSNSFIDCSPLDSCSFLAGIDPGELTKRSDGFRGRGPDVGCVERNNHVDRPIDAVGFSDAIGERARQRIVDVERRAIAQLELANAGCRAGDYPAAAVELKPEIVRERGVGNRSLSRVCEGEGERHRVPPMPDRAQRSTRVLHQAGPEPAFPSVLAFPLVSRSALRCLSESRSQSPLRSALMSEFPLALELRCQSAWPSALACPFELPSRWPLQSAFEFQSELPTVSKSSWDLVYRSPSESTFQLEYPSELELRSRSACQLASPSRWPLQLVTEFPLESPRASKSPSGSASGSASRLTFR